MKNTTLSSRYAKAYIDLAVERSQMEQAVSACRCAIDILNDQPEIERVLGSPLEPVQSKLDCARNGLKSISESLVSDLITLVISKGRASYLREIFEQAIILNDKLLRVVNASVFSAEKLSEQQIKRIESNIKSSTDANTVELSQYIDSSLLGGFKVTVGDKVWDSTIAGQLENIKKKYS